jgi:hypothetical protein
MIGTDGQLRSEIVERLTRVSRPDRIILFGSAARGDGEVPRGAVGLASGFVVDRRIVVDEAYARADRIAARLRRLRMAR